MCLVGIWLTFTYRYVDLGDELLLVQDPRFKLQLRLKGPYLGLDMWGGRPLENI